MATEVAVMEPADDSMASEDPSFVVSLENGFSWLSMIGCDLRVCHKHDVGPVASV